MTINNADLAFRNSPTRRRSAILSISLVFWRLIFFGLVALAPSRESA